MPVLPIPWFHCAMQHTGPVIRETRKQLKMSLRELAERSEVDYTTISRIEQIGRAHV